MALGPMEGPPILGDAPLQMPPPTPEEMTGEGVIIDIKTASVQYSSIEDWFRRPSEVEEGVVNRYFDEIRSKRNAEGKYIRPQDYEREFEKDPQGYLEQTMMATPAEEWERQIDQTIAFLEKLQATVEDPSKSGRELREGLINLRNSGKNEIGPEASQKMADFIDALAKEKEVTRKQRQAIANAIQRLIEQQADVKLELLGAGQKTRFQAELGEILSEEDKKYVLSYSAQAYIRRQFMNYKYRQDEGSDKRLAYFMMLRDQREFSPTYVFDGRERHVYESWLAGLDIVDQLETENNPLKRAKLEKQLAHHKAVVRKWTSIFTTTLPDRMELGPTGLEQVQSIAWDEVKNTINKLREPSADPDKQSNDIDNPTEVKSALVNTGATYTSWEIQGHKNDVYLQYGVTWNAYKRLKELQTDPTELADFISLAFDGKMRRGAIAVPDIDRDIRRAKEKLDEAEAKLRKAADRKREQDDRVTAAAVAEANATSVQASWQAEYLAASATTDAKRITRAQEELRKADEMLLARAKAHREALAAQKEGEDDRKAAEEERDRLRDEYNPYDPTYLDPVPVSTPDRELVRQQQVDDYITNSKDAANLAYTTAKDRARQQQFEGFLNKVRDYLNSDSHINFYTHFNEDEVKLLAKMNNLGTHVNTRKNNLVMLAPGMAVNASGGFKLEKKKVNLIDGKEVVEKNETDKEVIERAAEFGIHFKGDFVFINPAAIPQFAGRLTVDVMEQILRHPQRYPKLANIVQYIKDNNCIAIVTTFAVENNWNGGSVERAMIGTGRAIDLEAVRRIKERHGWTNIDLFRAWIDDPRIQKEIGIRPDEMIPRIVASRAHMHQWQRELLPNHTVVNITDTTGVAGSSGDEAPMFFEFMIEHMMAKYGRLSAEDIDDNTFDQQLPRTGEMSYTVVQADGTMATHFRNETITDNDRAPKNEMDLMYQSLMNQLILYESHSKYYNQARNYTGPKTEDEIYKMGAFIKSNVELIDRKILELKGVYYNNDPAKTIEDKIQDLINFRETQMNHLTYELIDDNGKIIASRKNKELWNNYNANIQWLGKLRREQKNAEDRYVATWMNRREAYTPNANGIRPIDVAEADYLTHKNRRLIHEVEVYGLGVDALGLAKDLDPKDAAGLLADKFSSIDVQQKKRLVAKQFRAVHRLDRSNGPDPHGVQLAMRRAFGLFANSVIVDSWRKMASRANEIANDTGIPLRLPVNEKLIALRPDQLAELMDKKDDKEIFERLAERIALGINTGYQETFWGIFDPAQDTDLFPGTGAIAPDPDRVAKALWKAYEDRRNADYRDATDRFYQRVLLGGIVENLRLGGYRITEIFHDANAMLMSDTSTVERRFDGALQTNRHGHPGTPMGSVDANLLQLERTALGQGLINFDAANRYTTMPLHQNNPTAVEQAMGLTRDPRRPNLMSSN